MRVKIFIFRDNRDKGGKLNRQTQSVVITPDTDVHPLYFKYPVTFRGRDGNIEVIAKLSGPYANTDCQIKFISHDKKLTIIEDESSNSIIDTLDEYLEDHTS